MNNDLIGSKINYMKGILSYVVIFYLVSILISSIVLSSLIARYSVDMDLLTLVISSDNLLEMLELYPTVTKCYIHISSLTNILTYVLLFTTIYFFLKEDLIKDGIDLKNEIKENNSKPFIKKTLKYFLIFYAGTITVNLLLLQIQNYIGFTDESQNQVFIELAFKFHPIIIIFMTIIFAPIIEELIFRKCIFGLFKNKTIALIVSSVVFGAIHIISSLSMGYSYLELIIITIPYVTCGLLLGFIYIKTNYNIYIPIIVHALSNAIAICFLAF